MASALLRNRLKERLAAGEPSLCLRSTLAVGPLTGPLTAATGFDAFYVDLEHAAIAPERAVEACAAAAPHGVTGLVRVAEATPAVCVPLLDGGAQGVLAAHVDCADAARDVVAACRFPPLGERSVSGVMPHFDFTGSADPAALDAATLVGVMIESAAGVAAVEEIAAVDGVDLLFVGSVDLRADLGVDAEDDPRVRAAYAAVARACADAGTAWGIGGVQSPAVIGAAVRDGARFVSAGHDLALLVSAGRDRNAALREATNLARTESTQI